MKQLPALPASVRALTSAESDRLIGKQTIQGPIDEWCPTCKGAKSFRWYNDMSLPLTDRDVVEYECPCADQFTLWRWFGYHGLDQYARLFWGDVQAVPDEIMAQIKSYLDTMDWSLDRGYGLYLHGTHGNGKTLLASLVLRKFMEAGHSGFFATWQGMLDMYTSGWRDLDERHWFDQTVHAAQVLVIDDLGKENVNRGEVGRSALDSVVRERVQAGRVTILTSNADTELFTRLYSNAMVSLAREACEDVHFVGADYRRDLKDVLYPERDLRLIRPRTFG